MYEDDWLAMCTGLRLYAKDADVVRLQIFYGIINVAHLKLTNDTGCNHHLLYHTGIMSSIASGPTDLQRVAVILQASAVLQYS